ncbi:hypothetical protein ACP70R_009577 [Stipagrostis hirtigluma subsp. patula]
MASTPAGARAPPLARRPARATSLPLLRCAPLPGRQRHGELLRGALSPPPSASRVLSRSAFSSGRRRLLRPTRIPPPPFPARDLRLLDRPPPAAPPTSAPQIDRRSKSWPPSALQIDRRSKSWPPWEIETTAATAPPLDAASARRLRQASAVSSVTHPPLSRCASGLRSVRSALLPQSRHHPVCGACCALLFPRHR